MRTVWAARHTGTAMKCAVGGVGNEPEGVAADEIAVLAVFAVRCPARTPVTGRAV